MSNQIPVSMSGVLHNKRKQKCCCSLLRCRLPFPLQGLCFETISLTCFLKKIEVLMYNKVRETFLHISFSIAVKMAEIIWSMRLLPSKLFASLTRNLTKGKEKIGREKVEDGEKDWLPDCGSPYATLTWMFSNSFLGFLSFLLSWYHCLGRHWCVCWGRMFCGVFHIFCQKMLLADIFVKKLRVLSNRYGGITGPCSKLDRVSLRDRKTSVPSVPSLSFWITVLGLYKTLIFQRNF